MAFDGLEDHAVAAVLRDTRRIALVGASARADRPSNRILGFLVRAGYDVTPVNPGLAGQKLHGQGVVASLEEAAPLEMVDLFRASDQVGPAVDEAIRLGARVIWMQLGVVNEAAAEQARSAGLVVVMDRCPAIELPRLACR